MYSKNQCLFTVVFHQVQNSPFLRKTLLFRGTPFTFLHKKSNHRKNNEENVHFSILFHIIF